MCMARQRQASRICSLRQDYAFQSAAHANGTVHVGEVELRLQGTRPNYLRLRVRHYTPPRLRSKMKSTAESEVSSCPAWANGGRAYLRVPRLGRGDLDSSGKAVQVASAIERTF